MSAVLVFAYTLFGFFCMMDSNYMWLEIGFQHLTREGEFLLGAFLFFNAPILKGISNLDK